MSSHAHAPIPPLAAQGSGMASATPEAGDLSASLELLRDVQEAITTHPWVSELCLVRSTCRTALVGILLHAISRLCSRRRSHALVGVLRCRATCSAALLDRLAG